MESGSLWSIRFNYEAYTKSDVLEGTDADERQAMEPFS